MHDDNGLSAERYCALYGVGDGAGRFDGGRSGVFGLNAVGVGLAELQALAASALDP
jgi:hypothetical protein